jgi:hypothetical protein
VKTKTVSKAMYYETVCFYLFENREIEINTRCCETDLMVFWVSTSSALTTATFNG